MHPNSEVQAIIRGCHGKCHHMLSHHMVHSHLYGLHNLIIIKSCTPEPRMCSVETQQK